MLSQDWLRNPIGFGTGDLLVLAVAVLLAPFVLRYRPAKTFAPRFAERAGWWALVLAILPIALRLALLPRFPAPTPSGADDFSFLLLADTFRHLRLANPMHPMRQFFEAVFILQEPAYASIFPPGQGIVLALGWIVFGHPWAGVLLSCAAFCGLCYWMLRGWVTKGWALVGGVLAMMTFGPLCQWTNLYWGGLAGAVAGCLVFGAIPRLRSSSRVPAALLGCGLAIELLTRPFECVLLAVCVAPFLWRLRRRAAIVVFAIAPAIGFTLLHDHAVTGSWTTLPYQLSRYQYGIPATFTFQPNPIPHRKLTEEQEMDYRAQSIIHGDGPETLLTYAVRWGERVRFYRFFFLTPLYLALPAFLFALRERRYQWIALTIAIFSLGANFYPYFYPHYIAALSCVFVLVSVAALERLSRWRPAAAVAIVCLCGAQFLFWYGVHAFASEKTLYALARYESWDFINYGDPEGRIAINRRLAGVPGPQLVFVHYAPGHLFHEWIHNDADIDRSGVIWAADLGGAVNDILRQHYPGRTAWVLEPDRTPPRLTPYVSTEPAEPAATAPAAPAPVAAPPPPLRFEEGPVHNSGGVREMQRKRR